MLHKYLLYILYAFVALYFTSCSEKKKEIINPSSLNVIPIPNNALKAEGFFEINSETNLEFEKSLESSAKFLNQHLKKGMKYELSDKSDGNSIVFAIDTNITTPESYKITVDEEKLLIESSDDKGAFYAVQTIRQLLPASFENGSYDDIKVKLDLLTIEDSPRYAYRGFMLDVARHFFTVEEVKQTIDLISLYKINTLHLHLTDDQGWRIDIKSWPNLTKHGSTSSVGNERGGFFTQNDYRQPLLIDFLSFCSI